MDLESDLYQQLVDEGLMPERWSNAANYPYPVHDHWYHKVVVAVHGEITFELYDGNEKRSVTLKPGDRLEIPAHTPHSAVCGPRGVSCLEARRERPG